MITSSLFEVSDIDAQFEADYKALRIKEMELMDTRMKTGIAAKAPTGPSKIQGKTFGELYEITKEELVDFVEKEGPNVLIFIHVYQIVRDQQLLNNWKCLSSPA